MMAKLKFAWALFALTTIAGLIAYQMVEPGAQIPIHWNIKGEADDWASPLFAFFMLPGVQLISLLLMSALPVLEPRKDNIGKSTKAVQAIVFGTLAVLAAAQSAIIAAGFGYEPMGPKTIIAAVGILFVVIGNYMTKLKSNFFIGIRTPWTLSSDTVWKKTHRLGAKLFMASGAVIFIGSFLIEAPYLAGLVLGTVLPVTLFIIFYSWHIWRQEKSGRTIN
ncbi:MAG: SdpI family protein [Alphaproteobacteria bacterium]|nr:SdpI family protein [Alphaproteobacteria bacterium]